jgi:hypothetical protein
MGRIGMSSGSGIGFRVEYADKGNSAVEAKLSALAAFARSAAGTAEQKLKAIQAEVADLLSYPTRDLTNPLYGEISALVGGVGVCEAYAKAFKYACDQAGIPAILVVGSIPVDAPHMWNLVEIEESWYAIDVTNEDRDPTLYDIFLSGKNTNIPLFKGKFSSAYKAIPFRMNTGEFDSFTYPTQATEKYNSSGGGTGGGGTTTPVTNPFKPSYTIKLEVWPEGTYVTEDVNDDFNGNGVKGEAIGALGVKSGNGKFTAKTKPILVSVKVNVK